MANYMVVDADQLNTNLTTLADKIRTKAAMTDQLSWPGGFNTAIENIPVGIDVKKTSGTFKTNQYGSTIGVNCGFKPDFVYIHCNESYNGTYLSTAFAFQEESRGSILSTSIWVNRIDSYVDFDCNRHSEGFAISAYYYPNDEAAGYSATFNYTAIKYTL